MEKKQKFSTYSEWYAFHFLTPNPKDSLSFLVDLVQMLRPRNPKSFESLSIQSFLAFLSQDIEHRKQIGERVMNVLHRRKFARILSDTGILRDSDFWYEIKQRAWAKILPFQPDEDTLEFVLNQVFYKSSDPIWLAKIPLDELQELFSLLGFSDAYTSAADATPLSELLTATALLSQRMSGRALESDVIKMVPEYADLESPFLAFENEFEVLHHQIRQGEYHAVSAADLNYKQLLILHKQCEEYVDKAFQNSAKFGISLKVNQSLLRIRQQLQRVKALLTYLVVEKPIDRKNNSILLALRLIRFNCQKNNVRQLFNESTQLIAYEITQHTARTGEHYITETRSAYFSMLKAALGGGFIV
ncbi:MAG: recombinase, partial [Flavobacterium stagni]